MTPTADQVAIFVRNHPRAPWRYGTVTADRRIVDQFRCGIVSGKENLTVLTLPARTR